MVLLPFGGTFGFGISKHTSQQTTTITNSITTLYDVKSSDGASSSTAVAEVEDDEKPADIVGAQFFGGNKEKEEFYDPVAEAKAGEELAVSGAFHRFLVDDAPSVAFDTATTAKLAYSLQCQINAILYKTKTDESDDADYTYSNSVRWTTPLSASSSSSASNTPLQALKDSLQFYRNQVDLAIVSGKQLNDNEFEIQWELSAVWPTFMEPRIMLVGTSKLGLDSKSKMIVSQIDQLWGSNDKNDLVSTIGSQISPRFWDWYHIGMTPAAELMPRFNTQKGLLKSYQVYEIHPRLVTNPTMLEVGDRDDRNAQFIPSHAFATIIKTMGPTRQKFVPTSPVEVRIIPGGEKGLKLKWSIPLSVQFQAQPELPLPGEDPEMLPGSEAECGYEFQPKRKVATVAYGGNPQDKDINEIRKKLYEQVVRDGLKPKLDRNGRPEFFFLQNTAKACYTEDGLGMCVYEWRPSMVKPNEVGIELELS